VPLQLTLLDQYLLTLSPSRCLNCSTHFAARARPAPYYRVVVICLHHITTQTLTQRPAHHQACWTCFRLHTRPSLIYSGFGLIYSGFGQYRHAPCCSHTSRHACLIMSSSELWLPYPVERSYPRRLAMSDTLSSEQLRSHVSRG
jgi:hypothetical protein